MNLVRRSPLQRQAECCPERPHFAKGLCLECHTARLAEAHSLDGQLRAAKAGVSHAAEVAVHFEHVARLAPVGSLEAEHAIELAGEWRKRAAAAAGDVLDIQRRISAQLAGGAP